MQYIMENIKTCELCLERIIKTENFENLNCNEKQNLTILKNLEINVSRDAKICSNCVNVSHLMYNFKMSCLINSDHLKTLVHSGINDKLILEEVIVKKTKTELKNEEKVCRFCLNFSEVNSLVKVNLEQDVVLKDMLRRCLPEIDTNIVQNPLICYICNRLLKKLYNFISRCEGTEVFRNLDPKTDILVNENTSTPTVENNDKNTNESFVKEENCDGIENPDLEIKSEDFDINEDFKDSIKESNCLLKKNVQVEPSSFPSGNQNSLVIHKKNHEKACGNCEEEKVQLYKCNICSFMASKKCEIMKHKKKKGHKDKNQRLRNPVEEKEVTFKPRGTIKEKKFICDICSYQTTLKSNAKRHYLIHKKPSEVNLLKCDYCSFATKWKDSLARHAICHKNPSNLPKFKCNDCPYETNIRRYLVCHVQVHKNHSQVNTYKCKVCPFQTKHKISIQLHEERHQAVIYTCDKCNYTSKLKTRFLRHLRHHKEEKQPAKSNQNLKEVTVRGTIKEKKFVCDICSYQATFNCHLKQHYLVHKKLSEVNLFKCDYCPFATKWKDNLTIHTIRHKNPSELPKFKCDYCSFATTWKGCLARHAVLHQNPSMLPEFNCNDCQYKTNVKGNLVRHVQLHKNHSEVNMYKCKVCPFQTKHKISIQLHEERHQAVIYTCDECNYTTKLKTWFLRHLQHHKDGKQPAKSNQNLKEVRQHNPVEEKDVKPKPRGSIKEKKFVCDICSYQTNINHNFKQHYLVHKKPSEVNLFKCDYCPFATKWKGCLARHAVLHQNPSKLPKFNCNDCQYKTNVKGNLVRHVQLHKNHSEVNMYKCKVCPFQTKHKISIQLHEERHQAVIYTCDECNYTTKLKTWFLRHLRHHKEEKQPAKSNQNLKEVRQHNPVEEKDVKPKPRGSINEKKFVCDICSYQTNINHHFKQHYLVHKKPSEVNLFKCDYCPFATKWKGCLARHAVLHQNFSKLPKFNCNDCQYKTNVKGNLVRHVQLHKNHSEVNMYKCKVCPFQTKHKISIQLHEERHQAVIYTCDECNYTTKLKTWFLRHLRYHKEYRQPANVFN